MSSHGGGESESTKTRPARGDLCLTSDVGKKKQDPLGGTYVSPVTWAKKTRPARGDLCLTSDVGKKQDPLGETYVSPVTWAKKNKTR